MEVEVDCPVHIRWYRSRRMWKALAWILGTLLVVGLLGTRAYLEIRANRTVAEWEAFRTGWEARGDRFDRPNQEPVEPEDNLIAHPWIRSYLAGTNPTAEHLGYLGGILSTDLEIDPDDSVDWFKRHETALSEARSEFSAHEADIASLKEACARPSCQFSADSHLAYEQYARSVKELGDLISVLSIHAKIQLASGNVPGAVESLEALLHLARHFENQNCMLGTVQNYAAKLVACETIDLGIRLGSFSDAEKQRLFDLFPAEPFESRLPRIMRNERNLSLMFMDDAAKVAFRSQNPYAWLNPFKIDPFKGVAGMKLDYCRKLQFVLNTDTKLQGWLDLDEEMKARKRPSIGESFLIPISGLVSAMSLKEKDLQATRDKLRP